MKRILAVLLVMVLPVVGAGLGFVAAPTLARTNATVRLAARVWLEDRIGLTERTLQSDAFRLTGGGDRGVLFERARSIAHRFAVGGLVLGLWLGLVAAVKAFTLFFPTAHHEFEVDHAWCVSCGRCYRWCPRSRPSALSHQPPATGRHGPASCGRAGPAVGEDRMSRPVRSVKTSSSRAGDDVPEDPAGQVRPGHTSALMLTLVTALFTAGVVAGLVATYVRHSKDTLIGQERLDALRAQLLRSPGDQVLRDAIRRADLDQRQQYFTDRRTLQTGAYLLLGTTMALILSAQWYASFKPRRPRIGTAPYGAHPPPRPSEAEVGRRALKVLAVVAFLMALGLAGTRLWSPHPLPPEDWEEVLARAAAQPTEEVTFTENWPRFRGPSGMGLAPTGDWPDTWDARTGRNILWKTPIPGSGKSSPIVWGPRVFLTSADIPAKRLEVHCLDRATGRILWTQRLETGYHAWSKEQREEFDEQDLTDTGYAAPTPATDGQRVFVTFATCDIACYDFAGKLLWKRNLGPPRNMYGLASSLLVHKGLVIWQLDQGDDAEEGLSAILALSAETGETVWRTERPVPASWSTPILATTEAGEELITTADPWVIAYDPASGIELWRATGVGGDVAASPVVAGDVVFVTSDGRGTLAIRAGGADDVTETHILWRIDDAVAHSASPVTDGRLLVHAGGYILCHDAATGEQRWGHDFRNDHVASPTLVGQLVYQPSDNGTTYIFDLGSSFRLRGRGDVGERIDATPAFADSRIYLRGEKHLFCIGKRDQ